MPLVVDPQEVIEAAGMTTLNDRVSLAAERAVETAQQSAASLFRTAFERVTVVDDFFPIDSLRFDSARSTELLLSRGLVDAGQTLTLYASATREGLGAASTRTNLQSNGGVNHVILDYERGLLSVADIDISKQYVRATYTAGLTNDGGAPALYLGAPEWLRQAVRVQTLLHLDSNPVFPPASREDDSPSRTADHLKAELGALVGDHARYVPAAWKPRIRNATAV